MRISIKHTLIVLFLGVLFSGNVIAYAAELIDTEAIARLGVPIHLIELFLALFISLMSLKFFRITRPLNIFLYIYLALGFFIVSSLLYAVFYARDWLNIDLNFVNVYIASRLSLIAMLFVFVAVFYNAHRVMTAPVQQNTPEANVPAKKGRNKK